MPSPSEKELNYYREVTRLIYLDKTVDRNALHIAAKVVIAEARRHVPEATDDTLKIFLASVALLTAHLNNVPVGEISGVLDRTFNSHMIAVASLLDIVNLNENEKDGPPIEEIMKLRDQAEAERDTEGQSDDSTGMYL